MLRALLLLLALLAAPAQAAPGEVRVLLKTSLGPIVLALETKRAPVTAANFLKYVDAKRFDGRRFYRAARSRKNPQVGLVQAGLDHDIAKSFFPIKHEPTSKTGLRHVDGAISMARNDPGTAMGDFFICVGDNAYLDARPNYPGYAVFGRVVSGMPLVRRILALKTYPGGFSQTTKGQTIIAQPVILSARRLP
ncbi:peptidylprolyl isomerase [Sphingomonas jatrophae]|uniref:peptidylprolyl isomerase n=1 Tax=Sphingomonas jatrophae TaxID=1166337 RepID=A0A1I6JZT8_9SPHN|nr:peptidylprolyl isomerase [Sphingomonas jatrophae]SFR84464.1 peptidyl-prolyl cis-trans isomerase A (cyclophilin A) [Sphingomonas jatrophae]